MYYQYFGLTEAPFSIAVNPRYLFMSTRHRDALAHLLYGVGAGGGFILLTGEVGTGKTTINRCLLEQLPTDTDVAIILNPALNALELLASVCDELDIEYDHQTYTLKTLTDKLHSFLLDNHARGRKTVLLIDEAQHLDFDVLEQIRLLTNLETNSEKLLQIILIGQPELAQMLARPELRQLNQRITARYNLDPLNLDETSAYIQHRLQVAGMSPERVLFTPAVVRGIYKATRGIPRVINVLCDRMLLGAYGRNASRVDHDMLQLAIREVLGEQAASPPPWRWLALAAMVLLLVWAAGWLLGKYSGMLPVDAVPVGTVATEPVAVEPVAQDTPAVDAASTGTGVTPAATDEPPGSANDTSGEDTVLAEASPVVSAATVSREQAPAPQTIDIASAMQPSGNTLARLWALNSDQPAPEFPCLDGLQYGLACTEGEVWTWDELAAFNRPLSLETITPERFSAEALLLGIEGARAWVWTEAGVAQVSLAELAPYWTGRYRFLWHPPPGFIKPLAVGDDSPVVAAVAQLFAQLDKQPQPLSGTRFNRALEQRVRMFQKQHALIDDGLVGVQTLLKLNEQLGVDVTAQQARMQLQQSSTQRSTE
ncbi:MAG: AAA family ATPase [Haliea sp.]|nr:AAA family ATPase [Haliea sp.]